jgi:hypothetical protein
MTTPQTKSLPLKYRPLKRAGVPRRFFTAEEQGVIDPDVLLWQKRLLDGADPLDPELGVGLALIGTGNTSLQASFPIKRFIFAQRTGLWVDWRFLVDTMYSNDRKDRLDLLSDAYNPDILVLDQISMHRQDWINDLFTGILKKRYDDGRPTVITMSVPVQTARDSLRPITRFAPDCLQYVEILGEDDEPTGSVDAED